MKYLLNEKQNVLFERKGNLLPSIFSTIGTARLRLIAAVPVH
jgi:hypothetical protein